MVRRACGGPITMPPSFSIPTATTWKRSSAALDERLGRLLEARHLVGECRAMQVADLGVVVAAGAVHGGAIVPHDDVVRPPDVGVDEPALRRVLVEVAQEGARLGHRPAL